MSNLRPPTNIESLMSEWVEDTQVDSTQVDLELLKISNLHGKYLNIMTHHRHIIRKLDVDYKQMKGLREDYLAGHLTQDELSKRGWEPCQYNHSNPKIARLLEVDPELGKIALKKIAHEEIVSFCEQVLKELHSRVFSLRSFVDYQRYIKGL